MNASKPCSFNHAKFQQIQRIFKTLQENHIFFYAGCYCTLADRTKDLTVDIWLLMSSISWSDQTCLQTCRKCSLLIIYEFLSKKTAKNPCYLAVILYCITLLWVHVKVFVLLRNEDLCFKPYFSNLRWTFLLDILGMVPSKIALTSFTPFFVESTYNFSDRIQKIGTVFYPKPHKGYMQISLAK